MSALYRLITAVTILALGLALAGCSADSPESVERPQPRTPSAEESPTAEPPATDDTEDLLAEITSAEYATWAPAPGYESLRPAAGPHGDQVQIFLDPNAEDALETSADAWPVDAIIVKDVYRDGELIEIAAMKKTPDGWYWGEWGEGGETVIEGLAAEPCQGCHSSGTDSTLAVDLR